MAVAMSASAAFAKVTDESKGDVGGGGAAAEGEHAG